MKKVFPSAEQTIHVWAQQSQEDGNSSNVFFENTKVLYSYGYHFPLAIFLDDNTVLVNNAGYSVTTSKQQGYVWGAIRHKKMLIADTEITRLVIRHHDNKDKNVRKFFKKELIKLVDRRVNDIVTAKARQASKRRKKSLIQTDIKEAETLFNEYDKLLQFFKFKMPVVLVRLVDGLMNDHVKVVAKFAEQHKKDLAKRERVREQHEKEKLVLAEKAIESWKCGRKLDQQEINSLRTINKIYMRPDGDCIRTSHGAQFPKEDAIKLFPLIRESKRYAGTVYIKNPSSEKDRLRFNPKNITMKLGYFDVDEISYGNVHAGCHHIKWDEIERNAKMLGLIEPDTTKMEV